MRCWDWFGDRSLVVIDIALACCALEVEAAAEGARVTDLQADDHVAVVVAGTVTDVVLPIVQSLLADVPQAKIISFGACASAGGPYWDSYAVTKGIKQIVDVDLFVAGCPPAPTALQEALKSLRRSPRPNSSAARGRGSW